MTDAKRAAESPQERPTPDSTKISVETLTDKRRASGGHPGASDHRASADIAPLRDVWGIFKLTECIWCGDEFRQLKSRKRQTCPACRVRRKEMGKP